MNYISDIPHKVEKSVIDGVKDSTHLYNAVVEISNGENVKYEIHSSGQYLTAVKALSPIFNYPFSYGYIPQTLAEDGDGLDVIIVTPVPLAHLSVVEIRVLGYVPTIDDGKTDNKIVAVPAYSSLKRVSMEKIIAFLNNYKYPNTASTSVGEFISSPSEAELLIELAHGKYLDMSGVDLSSFARLESDSLDSGDKIKSENSKSDISSAIDNALLATERATSLKPLDSLVSGSTSVSSTKEEDNSVGCDAPSVSNATQASIGESDLEVRPLSKDLEKADLDLGDSGWLT